MLTMIPRYRPSLKWSDAILAGSFAKTSTVQVEELLAQKVGAKYAVILPYARCGLIFLLNALEIKGRKIALPAFNCQSMLGAILQTENTPVFVDSDKTGLNLNVDDLPSTSELAAIVPSAMFGYPLDASTLQSLRRKAPLVIGDFALGLSTFVDGNRAGSILAHIDAALFSFGLGKEVSFLGGGALVTNDRKIRDLVENYRNKVCFTGGPSRNALMLSKFALAKIAFAGFPYKALRFLSEQTSLLENVKGNRIGLGGGHIPDDYLCLPSAFQLTLAQTRLQVLHEIIASQRALAANYFKLFSANTWCNLTLLDFYDRVSHFHICVTEGREELRQFLLKNGVHATVIFKHSLSSLHLPSKPKMHADRYAKSLLALPLFVGMSERQQQRVFELVRAWDQNKQEKALHRVAV